MKTHHQNHTTSQATKPHNQHKARALAQPESNKVSCINFNNNTKRELFARMKKNLESRPEHHYLNLASILQQANRP